MGEPTRGEMTTEARKAAAADKLKRRIRAAMSSSAVAAKLREVGGLAPEPIRYVVDAVAATLSSDSAEAASAGSSAPEQASSQSSQASTATAFEAWQGEDLHTMAAARPELSVRQPSANTQPPAEQTNPDLDELKTHWMQVLDSIAREGVPADQYRAQWEELDDRDRASIIAALNEADRKGGRRKGATWDAANRRMYWDAWKAAAPTARPKAAELVHREEHPASSPEEGSFSAGRTRQPGELPDTILAMQAFARGWTSLEDRLNAQNAQNAAELAALINIPVRATKTITVATYSGSTGAFNHAVMVLFGALHDTGDLTVINQGSVTFTRRQGQPGEFTVVGVPVQSVKDEITSLMNAGHLKYPYGTFGSAGFSGDSAVQTPQAKGVHSSDTSSTASPDADSMAAILELTSEQCAKWPPRPSCKESFAAAAAYLNSLPRRVRAITLDSIRDVLGDEARFSKFNELLSSALPAPSDEGSSSGSKGSTSARPSTGRKIPSHDEIVQQPAFTNSQAQILHDFFDVATTGGSRSIGVKQTASRVIFSSAEHSDEEYLSSLSGGANVLALGRATYTVVGVKKPTVFVAGDVPIEAIKYAVKAVLAASGGKVGSAVISYAAYEQTGARARRPETAGGQRKAVSAEMPGIGPADIDSMDWIPGEPPQRPSQDSQDVRGKGKEKIDEDVLERADGRGEYVQASSAPEIRILDRNLKDITTGFPAGNYLFETAGSYLRVSGKHLADNAYIIRSSAFLTDDYDWGTIAVNEAGDISLAGFPVTRAELENANVDALNKLFDLSLAQAVLRYAEGDVHVAMGNGRLIFDTESYHEEFLSGLREFAPGYAEGTLIFRRYRRGQNELRWSGPQEMLAPVGDYFERLVEAGKIQYVHPGGLVKVRRPWSS